jgi:hypothetical protein
MLCIDPHALHAQEARPRMTPGLPDELRVGRGLIIETWPRVLCAGLASCVLTSMSFSGGDVDRAGVMFEWSAFKSMLAKKSGVINTTFVHIRLKILVAIFVAYIAATVIVSDGRRYCADGTTTNSSGRGTCSWHGGYGTQQEKKVVNWATLAVLGAWGYFSFLYGRDKHPKPNLPTAPVAAPPRVLPSPGNANPVSDFRCSRCGGDVRLRIARRGTHAGKKFWGCSRYPRCKGIRDFEPPVEAPTQRINA